MEYKQIYCITYYTNRYYRDAILSLDRTEARRIAAELEAEGCRWVRIHAQVIYKKAQIEAVDSYLASRGM